MNFLTAYHKKALKPPEQNPMIASHKVVANCGSHTVDIFPDIVEPKALMKVTYRPSVARLPRQNESLKFL